MNIPPWYTSMAIDAGGVVDALCSNLIDEDCAVAVMHELPH